MRLHLTVSGRPDLAFETDVATDVVEAVAAFVERLDRDGFDVEQDMRIVVSGDHTGWYRPHVTWVPIVRVERISPVVDYSVELHAVGFDKHEPLGTIAVRSTFGHGHAAMLAVEDAPMPEGERAVEAVVTRVGGSPVGRIRTFGLTRTRARPEWKVTPADHEPVMKAVFGIETESSVAERMVAQEYLDAAIVAAWEAILRERKR
ncbi:hypothetical protein [Aureimonas sp. SK2]|uniref:hypothetical protein n=1 Tax=Aureimonas sp. SK2 TaxID=3015992 RepID=UPI002444307E|nr:hypothetical protein [Aureimonas sp. SK2]